MHIILYVLDALRADHLGCYGYGRNITPHIDQLAADGVVFANCFTSTTWTRPVAASILTGVYPTVHQATTRDNMFSVGSQAAA
jgi:choline-sulfatase